MNSIVGNGQESVGINVAVGKQSIEPRWDGFSPQRIPLDGIDHHPDNPRLKLDEEHIAALASNINARLGYDITHAIKVRRKADGRFEIISGAHRTEAARLAGLTHVWAYVVEMSDLEALVALGADNKQREVGTLELGRLALRIQQTGEHGDLSVLAKAWGTRQDALSKYLAAAKVWTATADSCVNPTSASDKGEHLSTVHALPETMWAAAVKTIVDDGLTVARTRALVRSMKEKLHEDPPAASPDEDQKSDGKILSSSHGLNKKKGEIAPTRDNDNEVPLDGTAESHRRNSEPLGTPKVNDGSARNAGDSERASNTEGSKVTDDSEIVLLSDDDLIPDEGTNSDKLSVVSRRFIFPECPEGFVLTEESGRYVGMEQMDVAEQQPMNSPCVEVCESLIDLQVLALLPSVPASNEAIEYVRERVSGAAEVAEVECGDGINPEHVLPKLNGKSIFFAMTTRGINKRTVIASLGYRFLDYGHTPPANSEVIVAYGKKDGIEHVARGMTDSTGILRSVYTFIPGATQAIRHDIGQPYRYWVRTRRSLAA